MFGFSCVVMFVVCCDVGLLGCLVVVLLWGLCVDYWFACLHDLVIGGFG